MYLKRIELIGFKSFADKTVLNFERGITSIVGPNGCGKSNVSDAIRWVLGEQSAKMLRGSNMQDVIFNGTEEKKPVGFAEVALTMGETDQVLPLEYNEVTVARRLSRSGESEYFINKTPCRLKDIQELFRGTGVGSNPYSMVEQGNIDMILSSKPEDRRFVFEEAAGITKFKAQKREALRKLEHTESNLVRVGDIIREIKKQITAIQRQASKAQKYKQLQEELKESECLQYKRQYTQLTEQIADQDKQIHTVQEDKEKRLQEINNLEVTVSEHRLQLESFSQALAQKNAEQMILDNDQDRLQSQIQFQNERIEENKQKIDQWTQEIEKIGEKLRAIDEEAYQNDEEIKKAAEETLRVSEEVKEKEAQLNQMLEAIGNIQTQLQEQKSQIVGTLSQETTTKNEMMQLQVEEKSLAQEKDRIKKELEENTSWQGKQREELLSLNEILSEEEMHLNKGESTFSESREQLTQVRFQLESLDKTLAKKGAEHSEKKSKLDLLQDLKNRFEGYYHGVKLVLQAAQSGEGLKGICGTVADLVHVPREYEVAIEVALGGRIQNIVADSAEDAKQAIFYLKKHDAGQATFLPLDLYRSGEIYQLPDKWSNPGVIGNACDFVEFDPKYYKIFKTLLGSTILVRDMDSALAVARHSEVRCQLVTLEGEAINSRGAITGGSNKNKVRGFISREGQIEELKREVTTLEKDLEHLLEGREASFKERESLEKKVQDLQQGLHHERVGVATKKSELIKMEASLKQQEENRELYESEIIRIKERISANLSRQREIKKDLDSATQLNVNLQSNLTEGEKDLLGRARDKDAVLEELTQLKIAFAQIQEKEKTLQLQKNQLEQSKGDQLRSLNQRRLEIEESVERGEVAASETLKLEGDLNSLQEKKSGFGGEIEEATRVRDEAALKIRELEGELSQARASYQSFQDEAHGLEIKLTQEKLVRDNLVAKAQEEYQVSLDSSELSVPEETDWEALGERVEELRAKIESMGIVNLVAIEELQELEERHAFLEKQHGDLTQAKDQLLQAIRKINSTMREMFSETFEKVRVNFKVTFTKLFNGGKADIVLMDDSNDILEAGIDIMARPPGKKLTSVSLMSGGERALTAVALLFALFKVKPSPFCVLDEIDAPLDESNINRFVQMVKEYVQQSQFIIVTHNKRTIATSDVMYGITMEESGVSKVVSVKFAHQEELVEAGAHEEKSAFGFAGK